MPGLILEVSWLNWNQGMTCGVQNDLPEQERNGIGEIHNKINFKKSQWSRTRSSGWELMEWCLRAQMPVSPASTQGVFFFLLPWKQALLRDCLRGIPKCCNYTHMLLALPSIWTACVCWRQKIVLKKGEWLMRGFTSPGMCKTFFVSLSFPHKHVCRVLEIRRRGVFSRCKVRDGLGKISGDTKSDRQNCCHPSHMQTPHCILLWFGNVSATFCSHLMPCTGVHSKENDPGARSVRAHDDACCVVWVRML